jgi:hypothetical protein
MAASKLSSVVRRFILAKTRRHRSDMYSKANMKECRSETRMLCADLVEVCWSDKTGQSYSAMANLEEISLRGAHLVLDVAVPLDRELVLRMKQGDIATTVKDCHHEPDIGFALTVQLLKKSRWKSHPRHLFDPRGLQRRQSEQNRISRSHILEAARD